MVTEQGVECTDEKTDSPDGTNGHGKMPLWEQMTGRMTRPVQGAMRIHGNPAPLFEALAKARADFAPVKFDRDGQIQNRKYRYATLAAVLDSVTMPLSANGLALFHTRGTDGEWEVFTHVLSHKSGAYLCTEQRVPCIKVDEYQGKKTERRMTEQEFGSAYTYSRRYAIQGLLGIAAEDDDDGDAASHPEPRREPQRTPPTPPQKAPKDVGREVVASLPKEAQATFKREDEVASRPASVPPDAILNNHPINDEMIDRIKKAYAAKGMGQRAATEHRNKVAGKSEGFTMADGEKVLHALRQEVV